MQSPLLLLALLGVSLLPFLASAGSASATAVVSIDGLSFDTSNNITLTGDNAQFNFRDVTFVAALNIASYTSVTASGQGNSNGGSASIDAITSVAYCPPIVVLTPPPSIWMAYFSASADANLGSLSVTGSVTASAAFLAKVIHRIEEIDSTGAIVETTPFSSLKFNMGSVQSVGSNDELKYLTYTATQTSSLIPQDIGFTVIITFAVSSVAGKLNVGGATITPKSIESFIEVNGYPYKNPSNFLRLTVYLAQAAAKASTTYSATQTVIAGSGPDQVYFKLAGSAVVDGSNQKVTVNGLATTNIDPSELNNDALTTQLASKGSLKTEVRKVTVDFPAGAAKISYDPAMGFGAPNSAGLLIPSFAVLLLSVFASFFLL